MNIGSRLWHGSCMMQLASRMSSPSPCEFLHPPAPPPRSQGQPREIEIAGKADAVERAYNMVMELINSEGAASTQAVIQKVRRS